MIPLLSMRGAGAVLLLLGSAAAHATVYTWRDESGALVVTNDASALPPGGGDSVQTYTARTAKRSAERLAVPSPAGPAETTRQPTTGRVVEPPRSGGPGRADAEREAEAYRRGFEQGREAAAREVGMSVRPTQRGSLRARAPRGAIAPRERPPFVVRVIPRPPRPFSTASSAESSRSPLESWGRR